MSEFVGLCCLEKLLEDEEGLRVYIFRVGRNAFCFERGRVWNENCGRIGGVILEWWKRKGMKFGN